MKKLDDIIFLDAITAINESFLMEITDNEVKQIRHQEEMQKLNND